MRPIAALRDESYTGSNRCWPCTGINVALLVLVVLFLRVRDRRVTSLLVATLGVAVVYLRGYLVPGTPSVAPRLVAASPVPDEWFHPGADPEDAGSFADAVEVDGEAVLEELVSAGVLQADGEMLYLAPDVESAWHERMADLAALPLDALADAVARSLPRASESDTLEADGKEWLVVGADDDLIARPVAVAELAAYQTLGDHLADETLRLAAAEASRMFLESCPVCGSALRESSEVSCCGGYSTPRAEPRETLVCPDCRQRLYTFPAD